MTKTSLCPAVDDQGRKCRKLQPHFDYEHIFMDDQSKGPIPPALSPEQWVTVLADPDAADWGLGTREHGTAALALYGQPFGFTREDVDRLRQIAQARTSVDAHAGIVVGESVAEWLTSLADRIASLLPPSDPQP